MNKSSVLVVMSAWVAVISGCKAKAPECTYKHQNPGFCMSPPEGYKPLSEATAGSTTLLGFSNGPYTLTVKWGGTFSFEDSVKSAKVKPGPTSSMKFIEEADL